MPPKREASREKGKRDEASRRDIPEEMRKIGALAVADGKQAVKVVRRHAAVWGVKPDRVGIMGFSACGMVTMGVAMDPDKESRPGFAAPIYGGGTGGARSPRTPRRCSSSAPPPTGWPRPAVAACTRSGAPPAARPSCTSTRRAATASA